MSITASSLIAQVKVEGDTETKQKLGEVSASVDKAGGVIGGLKGAFSGAFAWISEGGLGNVISAFDTLRGAFGSVLQESLDAQAGMAQTVDVLRSTHDASGETADAIANLAGDLSHLTTFSDDTVQAAENMLLTFTNIGHNVFPQATKTVLDMSQALGQDTKNSAIQLGKALNDPITGITALSRVGVTFDDNQKKLIKTYIQHNELAKAQGVILQELQREFGGSAEAAGKTFAGQMTILNQRIADVKQSIGDALLPIVTEFVGVVSNEVLPVLSAAGDWLASTGVPAFEKFASGIYESVTQSKPFRDILAEIGTDLKIVGSAFQEIFFPIQKVQDVTKPLTDTFDHATGAIHTVSTALTPLTDTFDRAKGVIGSTTVATKPLLDTFDRATVIIPKVTTFITKTTEATNPLVALFRQWRPVIEDVFKDVQILAGDVLTFATGVVDAAEKSGFFQSALQFLHDELPVVGTFLVNVGSAINTNLLPPLESLITNVGSAAAGFLDWADKSGVAKTTLDTLGGAIQLTTEILGPLIQAVSDVVGWLGGGGAGTDTLVFALSAAATAFTLLKIADTTAQFGSFISKLQEGDGIITNLASSVKDKLAKAFDDFLANQAPNLKASMDSVKLSAEEAVVAEEAVAAAPADTSAAGWFANLESSLGGVEGQAVATSTSVAEVGTVAETTMAEGVAVGATESEASLAGVGLAADEAKVKVAEVGTTAETSGTQGSSAMSGLGGIIGGLVVGIALVGNQFAFSAVQGKSFTDQFRQGDWLGSIEHFIALGTPGGQLASTIDVLTQIGQKMGLVKNDAQDMDKKTSAAAAEMQRNVVASGNDMANKMVASLELMRGQGVTDATKFSDSVMAVFNEMKTSGINSLSDLDASAKSYLQEIQAYVDAMNGQLNLARDNAAGRTTGAGLNRKNQYASGTDYAPGGNAIVAEAGAELVFGPRSGYLPQGSRVIPHDQSMAMLGSGWGGGGGETVIHNHIYIDGREIAPAAGEHQARQTRLRYGRRAW